MSIVLVLGGRTLSFTASIYPCIFETGVLISCAISAIKFFLWIFVFSRRSVIILNVLLSSPISSFPVSAILCEKSPLEILLAAKVKWWTDFNKRLDNRDIMIIPIIPAPTPEIMRDLSRIGVILANCGCKLDNVELSVASCNLSRGSMRT